MFVPMFEGSDGYGLTVGARIAYPKPFGEGSRLSFPMTVGGSKRIGVELDKTLANGPFSRIEFGTGVQQRRNPAFDTDDDRFRVWGRAFKMMGTFRAGGTAGWQRVWFGGQQDEFKSAGLDVTVDTRDNPAMPRNAVLATASTDVLFFDAVPMITRTRLEATGYIGIIGQHVLVLHALREDADHPLPPYLRPILGGWWTLRGFETGFLTGDTLVSGSLEYRVPLVSPRRIGKLGVSAFADWGTAYDHGQSLSRPDDLPGRRRHGLVHGGVGPAGHGGGARPRGGHARPLHRHDRILIRGPHPLLPFRAQVGTFPVRRSGALALAAALCMAVPVRTAPQGTVDELVAKNLAAKGGLAKLKAVETIKQTATMSMMGTNVPMTIYTKRPNMVRQEMTVDGKIVINAFDGETPWIINPIIGAERPIVVSGPQAAMIKEQSSFDGPLVDYKEPGHHGQRGRRRTGRRPRADPPAGDVENEAGPAPLPGLHDVSRREADDRAGQDEARAGILTTTATWMASRWPFLIADVDERRVAERDQGAEGGVQREDGRSLFRVPKGFMRPMVEKRLSRVVYDAA